ncbi:hypothetical protein NDN08_000548 [Rhodosorus marinus]|uniref:tRNA/rRNA methyltransferase SpoU type domain-containing protein n=1 Tax=Rhodosorus marinus TaxID=101924 RepID=A0AAV8UR21_9RHOD|nr:hypothetical protein NDN08_000548 [Rhodosorus marinus]
MNLQGSRILGFLLPGAGARHRSPARFRRWLCTRAENFQPTEEVLDHAVRHRTRHMAVVLDQVSNLRNLGSVCRSCDANGVQDLHIIPKRSAGQSEEEALDRSNKKWASQDFNKISRGVDAYLSVHRHLNAEECAQELRDLGYKIYASSLHHEAVDLDQVPLGEPLALVFGNERTGVSDEFLSLADGYFRIPMMGLVESFNIAVAAAVSMDSVISRARVQLPAESFYLSSHEQNVLLQKWTDPHTLGHQRKVVQLLRPQLTSFGLTEEKQMASQGLFMRNNANNSSSLDLKQLMLLNQGPGVNLNRKFHRAKFGIIHDRDLGRSQLTFLKTLVGPSTLLTSRTTGLPVDVLKPGFERVVNFIIDQFSMRESNADDILDDRLEETRQAVTEGFKTVAEFVYGRELETDHIEEKMEEVLSKAVFSDILRVFCSVIGIALDDLRTILGSMPQSENPTPFASIFDEILQRFGKEIDGKGPNLMSELFNGPAFQFERRSQLSDQQLVQLEVLLRFHHDAFIAYEILSQRNLKDFKLSDETKMRITCSRTMPYECMIVNAFQETLPEDQCTDEQGQVQRSGLANALFEILTELSELKISTRRRR